MQGLFKLGIVGTREQMEDFLKKVPENELLAGWVLEEEPAEAGEGLRTVEGYGVKPFLDRCKLVVENDGSGNISGLEEMADEISRLVPELEVVLLTQYMDYDEDDTWNIYYSPAGSKRGRSAYLYCADDEKKRPGRVSKKNFPSVEYLARLFAGCWALDLNVPYRARPKNFDGRFAGKTFLVTGNPDDYGRKGTEELIQKFGGVVCSEVSGETDYLVAGKHPWEQYLAEARELGVKILDVDAFEAMVAQ